jgi:hypothetical protein
MNLLSSYLTNLIQSGYRTNAFAPLVWFNAVVDIPLLICSYHLSPPMSYFALAIVLLLILASFVTYLIIFFKDPKLLQSESYRLEDRKLDLIQEKGGAFMVNPVDLSTPLQRELGPNENLD